MKTIIARFTELKQNVAGTAESEFDDLSFNDVDTALKSVGISLKDTSGQFRNLDEVLLELNSIWSTLDRNQQRYLATVIAGSRQQSRLLALMDDYDRTLELVNVAQDSAGRASEQFAKYEDTLTNKINKLKNSWEKLRLSFADNSFFKGAVDLANQFVSALGDLNKGQLAVVTLLGANIGKNLTLGVVKSIKESKNILSKAWNEALVTKDVSKSLKGKMDFVAGVKTNQNASASDLAKAAKIEANYRYNPSILKAYKNELQKIIDKENESGQNLKLQNVNLEALRTSTLSLIATYGQYPSEIRASAELVLEQIAKTGNQEEAVDQLIKKEQLLTEEQRQQLNLAIELAKKIKEAGGENLLDISGDVSKKMIPVSAASQVGGVITDTISQSLIAGITAGLGGGDMSTILKTTLFTGVTEAFSAAIPAALDKASKGSIVKDKLAKLAGLISTPQGAIAAAVLAAVGVGIYAAFKAKKKYELSVDVDLQTKAAEEKLKTLREAAKEASTNLTEKTNELKTLEDAVSTVTKLQGKITKTEEEQEKFNTAVETLQENYPELISLYDEETQKITINNTLLRERKELLQNQTEELQKQSTFTAIEETRQAGKTSLLQKGQEFESLTGAKLDARNIIESINARFDILSETNYDDWAARWESLENLVSKTETDTVDYGIIEQIGEYVYDNTGSLDAIQGLDEETKVAIEKLHAEVKEFKDVYLSEIQNEIYQQGYQTTYERIKDDTSLTEADKIIQAVEGANITLDLSDYGEFGGENRFFEGSAKDTKEQYKKIISNFEEKYDLDAGEIGLGKLADNMTAIYSAISENAYKAEDDYEDVIKNLNADQKKLLENMGVIDQDTYTEFIKSADEDQYTDKEMAKQLADKVLSILTTTAIENLDDVDTNRELNEDARAAINTLTKSDVTGTEYKEAYDSLRGQFDSDEEFFNTFSQSSLNLASNFSNINFAMEVLGEKTEFTKDQAAELANIYSNLQDSGAIQSAQYMMSDMASYLTSQGVGVDQLSKYLQLDWTTIGNEQELKTFKQQTIKEFTETGYQIDSVMFDALSNIAEKYKALDTVLSNSAAVKNYSKVLKELQATAFEKKETFIDILNESAEKGYLSLEKYLELEQLIADLGGNITIGDLTTIDKNGKIKLDNSALQAYYIEQVSGASKLIKEQSRLKDELAHATTKSQIEMYQGALEQVKIELVQAKNLQEAYLNDWVDSLAAAAKETETDLKSLKKSVLDAQQDIIDKQKELNEVLYGTKDWINNAEDMYNYATNLDRVTAAADDAKSALEDLQDWDNPQEAMDKYIKNVKDETAISQAEIEVYQKAIQNGQEVFQSKLSEAVADLNKKYGSNISINFQDLYTKVGDRYNLDYDRINSLQVSDDIKSMLVKEVQSWNDNLDKIDELQDQKIKRQKEFNELYKNSLQGMVDLEEKMQNTLKEKYENEISDIENKYKAMEEADNDYVDELEKAIEKQRKLRDQENSWRDLAEKERKLSLMQRDTSGGNLAQTRSLQQEVQDDREQLLDDTVDNIIDNLKDLYELQQESREAEIEYRKELLNEGMLMQEVTAALSNINSAEDLVAWFYENTADLSSMSAEQIQLEEMEWRELYDAKMSWLVTGQTDFNEALNVTAEDINDVINTTSETLTTSAQTTLDQVAGEVDEAIADAQEALNDAYGNLKEQQGALNKAIEESNNAAKAWKTSAEEVRKVLAKLETDAGKKTDENGYNPSDYYEDREKAKSSAYGDTSLPSVKGRYNPSDYYESKAKNPLQDTWLVTLNWAQEQINKLGKGGQSYPFTTSEPPKNSSLQQQYEALHKAQELKGYETNHWAVKWSKKANRYQLDRYATGGLVNYTGPAWVDGTKSRPEAFLSAQDTERIGNAAKLLADLPLLDSSNWKTNQQITNTNVGDTTLEFHINIENISNDYDVDQAIERVKKEIVDSAKYTGSNVIIRKT